MSIEYSEIKVKVEHSTLNEEQVTTGLRPGWRIVSYLIQFSPGESS